MVAVMSAKPSAAVWTAPPESTRATAGLLDDHATLGALTGLPAASRACADSWTASPDVIRTAGADTYTVATDWAWADEASTSAHTAANLIPTPRRWGGTCLGRRTAHTRSGGRRGCR